jgi:hypothetical protein
VIDWLRYVKATKTLASPAYPEMMNKFVGVSAIEYYQDHMEDYNPDFKYQLAEFKEGTCCLRSWKEKFGARPPPIVPD